ncbi:drug/metabolite transporter (DMT)-like permease [Variovorax beijingensis]|uniref:Drug/metabolite transporter (DMT)-like permease n=2 Tax=Variovorax TaxID=34072 RepID=A0AAE3XUF8_VARPD|nr:MULTISPECIES: EamA family transporter [Variovorax]MDP9966376.1 drug/metabolite transporter (DMT)-like permease [Variovorax paradoxus]MDR6424080.1 drug/metabolite transporter (DMT)-like permease [Variovorax paradoxus]TWD88304.1 drug/metabolite transporter (DMT)-like permease [Variovorax beijingensis]
MPTTTLAAAAAKPPPRIAFEWMLLAVLATCWGASYTFIKIGVQTLPPVTLIAARTLIAGLLLLGLLRLRGVRLPREPAMWRRFALQACLNSVLPFTLIAWAERSVDAGLATILNSTSPIFIFLLGLGMGGAEKPTLRRLFGVAAGLAGICLIVGFEALHGLGHSLLAQLGLVAAAVCYGCAAMFGRVFKGLDPMVPAGGSLLCGAAMLLPASLAIDRPWTLAPSAASMAAVLALAVLSTALAFTIYFRLIKTLGPMSTAAQAYLRVPVGVMIGVAFLGEVLSPTAWAGLACIVAGVVAMTVPARSAMARIGGSRPASTRPGCSPSRRSR